MERIGPYRILKEIAHGAAGVVYRARDEALKRDVAVKVLIGHGLSSLVELERFRTEARASARLRHPGIVAVHTAGVVSGRPYLVLDLIDGPSLDRHVRRVGPLPLREAAGHAAAVARALHYAHKQGLIHRDVKPGNILLARGEVYLTDFGLAKTTAVGDLTATGEVLGTPAYMPPEQANGQQVTVTSDVYSLGASLYHLLTGQPPFQGSSGLDTLRRVLTESPPRPTTLRRDLDPELEAIILKCMAKEPSDRYLDAATLTVELEAWLAGQASNDLIQAERRGRGAVIALGVALLITVGGAGWLASQLRQAETKLAALREARPAARPTTLTAPPRKAKSPAEEWLARGLEHWKRRRWQAALDAFGNGLHADADHVPTLKARGRTWLALNYGREAAADLARAVSLEPGDGSAWADRARAQLAAGDADAALEAIKTGLAHQPTAGLYALAGDIHMVFDRHPLALTNYGNAVRLSPTQPRLRLLRARAFVKAKRPDQARADLEVYLNAVPGDPEGRLLRGALQEDPLREIADLQRGAQGEGRHATACLLRYAELHAKAGSLRKALEAYRAYLRRALVRDPAHPAALKKAAELAKQLERNPVEPRLASAMATHSQGIPAGMAALEEIQEEHPKSVFVLHLCSIAAGEDGRLEDSLRYLQRAIALTPDDPRLRAIQIVHLALLARTEQALTVAKRALAKRPADPRLLLAEGQVLDMMGRDHEARDRFTQAIAGDPRWGLACALRGRLSLRKNRWRGALWDLTLSLRYAPYLIVARIDRGVAFSKLERHDDAMADFTAVLDAEPGHPIALLGRADASRSLGRRAEATTDYREFLRVASPESADAARVQLQLKQWER